MSGQNTSNAVMSSRVEPADSLDFFPTRAWATRALCEWLHHKAGEPLAQQSVWEPACGEGHMVKPLREYFKLVRFTDIHDYGIGADVTDFLVSIGDFDWIITNPPFLLAEKFALRAYEQCWRGCALIVRTAFLESAGRYNNLFRVNPPTDILQFTERVPMHRGRVEAKGSTATAYCWLVWRKDAPTGTHFHWIPPCRVNLERASDYEVAA
jgi:hypothetical protein